MLFFLSYGAAIVSHTHSFLQLPQDVLALLSPHQMVTVQEVLKGGGGRVVAAVSVGLDVFGKTGGREQ